MCKVCVCECECVSVSFLHVTREDLHTTHEDLTQDPKLKLVPSHACTAVGHYMYESTVHALAPAQSTVCTRTDRCSQNLLTPSLEHDSSLELEPAFKGEPSAGGGALPCTAGSCAASPSSSASSCVRGRPTGGTGRPTTGSGKTEIGTTEIGEIGTTEIGEIGTTVTI
jgi:hypothetical protein